MTSVKKTFAEKAGDRGENLRRVRMPSGRRCMRPSRGDAGKSRRPKNGVERRTYDPSCYRRLHPDGRRSPPPPVRSSDRSRMPLIRMSSQSFVSAVPFGALSRCLRLMASITQPLKIAKVVVVAGNDVVTVSSDAVASLRVPLRFASSVRARLDGGPALRPVVGEPESSVAAVPVHPLAHPPPSTPGPDGTWRLRRNWDRARNHMQKDPNQWRFGSSNPLTILRCTFDFVKSSRVAASAGARRRAGTAAVPCRSLPPAVSCLACARSGSCSHCTGTRIRAAARRTPPP